MMTPLPTKPKPYSDISAKIVVGYWIVPTLLFLSMLLIVNTPLLMSLWPRSFWSPLTESKSGPLIQSSVGNLSPPPEGITCNRSNQIYDLCKITGPTILDSATSTFYTFGPPAVQKIKPYPRKQDSISMSLVQELTLASGPITGPTPTCQVHHNNSPAVVFSAGGYTGNFFHDFSEGFIPLFITVNTLFADNRDFVLVVSEAHDGWIRKYSDLLQYFSRHPIVFIGNQTADVTHCFGSAVVGLISHGMLTVNPNLIPGSLRLIHFRDLLEEAYGAWVRYRVIDPAHSHNNSGSGSMAFRATSDGSGSRRRPKMVLISRPKGIGRAMLNEEEVRAAAEEVGFELVVFRPTSKTAVREAYQLMDSAEAVVGVHGAGMTHLLFMRPGAALVQVVPLAAEWAAEVCYGSPAKAMGLEYKEYRIAAKESSLAEKYGLESLAVKDPTPFGGKGWGKMKMYSREQDVRIDLVKFRVYLEEAYNKALKFMRTKDLAR